VGSALIADAHEAILNTISDIDADYSD
jgi:hypothetical protein